MRNRQTEVRSVLVISEAKSKQGPKIQSNDDKHESRDKEAKSIEKGNGG
jgi:hypothetical protein